MSGRTKEQWRAYMKERRRQFEEAGLCKNCGGQREDDKKTCQSCREKAKRNEYMKERGRRFREAGLCGGCGQKPQEGQKMCQRCLERAKKHTSTRRRGLKEKGICRECSERPVEEPGAMKCAECRAANRDYCRGLAQKRRAEGLCIHCGRQPRPGRKVCARCRRHQQAHALKRKLTVFQHYGGPHCNCCGESILEFLQLDHVNGDGARHRKELGAKNMYIWVMKNGYPPGFQVLCANCNWGRRITGICPHKCIKDA